MLSWIKQYIYLCKLINFKSYKKKRGFNSIYLMIFWVCGKGRQVIWWKTKCGRPLEKIYVCHFRNIVINPNTKHKNRSHTMLKLVKLCNSLASLSKLSKFVPVLFNNSRTVILSGLFRFRIEMNVHATWGDQSNRSFRSVDTITSQLSWLLHC